MNVIADVQVKVCDLEVVGRLTYVIVPEQFGHFCILVSSCGCLLGTHLLG